MMKKKILLLFIVLLGLSWYTVLSAFLNNPQKIEECLAKAAELESKGIYVDAITEYEKALEYKSDDENIILKMAKAYLNTGNSKEYIRLCKELAESNQDNSEPLDTLITYYVEKNEEADAVKYLKEFTETYPQNETAQKWLIQLKGSFTELYNMYEQIEEVYNNSMSVKTESGYGIADALGTEILAPELQETHPYSEDGLALIYKEGKYLYVDEDGQTRLVPDDNYTELHMMSAGRTVAALDGKYGYLNDSLEPVTEFGWDQLTLVQNGVGAGQKDGKWALLNEDGESRTDYIFDDVITDSFGFCFKQERAFVKQNGQYYLINKKGKEVGELKFDDARCFSDAGYAAVCKDGLWGYINEKGELVIDYQYENAQSFSNGFAAVCENGLWGYIDEYGVLTVNPQFEQVSAITEKGTAAVLSKNKWKLIQLNWFQ